MKDNYSVLMSVYYKEKANYLYQSMMSIFAQTVQTNDFVLVSDGPLTSELNSVIEEACKNNPGIIHVIRLETNRGLGNALNIGLQYCKNELVARMDSDDIAFPDRCEKQLNVFHQNPELSLCSGTVLEFIDTTNQVTVKRSLPETNEEILRFVKQRNPFNHPCVMLKKSAVQNTGGYKDLYLLEDYYLWCRMLLSGEKGYNIQEPILYMRADKHMYERRGGRKYVVSQYQLFKFMYEIGFISKAEEILSIVIRSCSAMAPNFLREFTYKRFLRSKCS